MRFYIPWQQQPSCIYNKSAVYINFRSNVDYGKINFTTYLPSYTSLANSSSIGTLLLQREVGILANAFIVVYIEDRLSGVTPPINLHVHKNKLHVLML